MKGVGICNFFELLADSSSQLSESVPCQLFFFAYLDHLLGCDLSNLPLYADSNFSLNIKLHFMQLLLPQCDVYNGCLLKLHRQLFDKLFKW